MDGTAGPVKPLGFGGLLNGPPSPARFAVEKQAPPSSLTLPTTVPGIIDLFATAPLVAKVGQIVFAMPPKLFEEAAF
jgi:hypothetical protein